MKKRSAAFYHRKLHNKLLQAKTPQEREDVRMHYELTKPDEDNNEPQIVYAEPLKEENDNPQQLPPMSLQEYRKRRLHQLINELNLKEAADYFLNSTGIDPADKERLQKALDDLNNTESDENFHKLMSNLWPKRDSEDDST